MRMRRAVFMVFLFAAFVQVPTSEAALPGAGYSKAGDAQPHQRQQRRRIRDPRYCIVRPTQAERNYLQITLERAQMLSISSSVEANGVISAMPDRVAKVGPVISGRISEVLVSLGDWVEAGQPMAKLVSVEIGSAVSEYYKAVAELELAQVEYDRYERLISQEIGARKDLIAAEATLKIAQAGLNASEKTLHALGFTEEDITDIKNSHVVNVELMIRAPIAGSVVERNVTVGERVGEDSTLFLLMDLRRLNVDAQLYERDINLVSKGQKTEISVNALPGLTHEGSVIFVGQTLDPETRTLLVRTAIDNPNGALRTGMFARVKIITGSDKPVLCVPQAAVLEDRGESFIFIPDGDSYKMIQVTTGCRDADWVEIADGLSEGDEVVVGGSYGLYSMYKQGSVQTGTR